MNDGFDKSPVTHTKRADRMFTLTLPDEVPAQSMAFWSMATEALFRSEGIISMTSEIVDGATEVVTAGGRRRSEGPVVFELDGSCPTDLGANWSPLSIDWLDVSTPTSVERVQLRQVNVRSDEGVRPASVDGTPWDVPGLTVMVPGAEWKVLLVAESDAGDTVPLVVRRGDVMVITAPIFGLASLYCSFPSLTARYGGVARGVMPTVTIDHIIKLVIDHHLAYGRTAIARVGRWPVGYDGCLSVRLDFDRKVDDEAMRSLVEWIADNRVGCSFGVLDYLRPPEVLAQLVEAGAEIQMHAFGEDSETVANQLAALRDASGYEVVGATVHGGSSGIGYRGDDHLEYFSAAGLSIGEVIGLNSHSPVPAIRPGESGATWTADFLAPPRHLSLDLNTRPDGHRRDAVVKEARGRLDRGEHAIVMNHPDIHRNELIDTFQTLASPLVWNATVRAVASWIQASRFQAVATPDGNVRLGASVEAARIDVLRPGASAEQVIVPGSLLDQADPPSRLNPQPSISPQPKGPPLNSPIVATFSIAPNDGTVDQARAVTGLAEADVLMFARQSNEYSFPLAPGDVGALSTPLPQNRFEAIVVERTCELFAGTTSVDWIAHMVDSLTVNGRLFLSAFTPDEAAKLGRIEPTAALSLLGLAPSHEGQWLVAAKPNGWEAPAVGSVLGAFLQGRGDFVMNAVLGHSVRGAAANRLDWFMGDNTLVDPFAPLNLARYDREDLIRIVERCRAGEIKRGDVEPGLDRPSVAVAGFNESAGRLAAHMRSWQNYVMYGTAYKAATIAPVLRREFSGQPIKFLEHGGYAGSLSMQLLADLPSIQEAWCCEVDPGVLPNTQLLLDRLPRSVSDRFRFSLGGVEEHVYRSDFDVIAFVHMLLYVRRDQLPDVLDRASSALRPGGLLMFLENTKPPTKEGGVDDAMIFGPGELDEYLSAIGSVEYVALKSGSELSAAQAEGKPVMRVVRPRS